MRFWITGLVLLICCIYGTSSAAPIGAGRHFIVAFPDTLRNVPDPSAPLPPSASIVIFAEQRTSVTIIGPGISRTVTVDSTVSTTVQLPLDVPLYLDDPDSKQRRTYDVRADGDIIVYAFFVTDYGSESFTPLPVDQWGTEYFAATARWSVVNDVNFEVNEEKPVLHFAPEQFAIIASVDGTAVNVSGPITRSFTLDAGEAYLIESDSLRPSLIGARITASQPVGVIAGATRTPSAGRTPGLLETRNTYQNVAIEWMAPTSLHGTFFAYAPVMRGANAAGEVLPPEIIRVVATSSGTTTVRTSSGRVKTLVAGDTLEITTATANAPATPFIVRTDKPAEAILVTGRFVRLTNESQRLYNDAHTYATSMVELTPRERWMEYSRFVAPRNVPGYEHVLVVYGDPAARIWLDGRELVMRTYTSSVGSMRYAYEIIAPGDHQLRSSGGRFAAVVHGHQRGYESYRPPVANPGSGGNGSPMPHPSVYIEQMAVSYGYPLSALPVSDALDITTEETCDSTVVVVDHQGGFWESQGLIYRNDPGRVNVDVRVSLVQKGQVVVGFRFVFRPIDPTKSASMSVRVISASGIEWPISYRYDPTVLEIVDNPISFGGVPVGVSATRDVHIINRGAGDAMITSARLRDASNGFTLNAVVPVMLGPGDTLAATISFIGRSERTVYSDSLIVDAECASVGAAVDASTLEIPREPVPTIDSVDWRERWLSTLNDCTKSGIASYDSLITVRNLGDRFFIVRSIALVGADADSGYFSLDGNDPALRIVAGDTVFPASSGAPPLVQSVRFRPRDERPYSCVVELVTEDDRTVHGELRGIGIESHIVVDPDPLDAGVVVIGSNTEGRATAIVRALPTRPLTVRALEIAGPDAAFFEIDETGGFIPPREHDPLSWWLLAPGETREVPLLYMPTETGVHVAQLSATGDHSRCDDSTTVVTGRAVSPVGVGQVRPIARSACGDTVFTTSLVNNSDQPVTIMRIDVAPAGVFSLATPIALPLVVTPGETYSIPIRFAPAGSGTTSATLEIDVYDDSMTRLLQLISVRFSGVAWVDSLHARVEVDTRLTIGGLSRIPVVLEAPEIPVVTGELRFSGSWNPRVMRLMDLTLDASIIEDWSLRIDSKTDSSVVAIFTPPDGAELYRGGTLCTLVLLPFLGSDTASAIDISINTVEPSCTVFGTTSATAFLDSICGLTQRLFEMFPEASAKIAAAPNPFDGATTIAFSLPVPGRARVDVIDANGRVVATLADEVLDAGAHVRTWEASSTAAGLYFVRMTTSGFVRTAPVVLGR